MERESISIIISLHEIIIVAMYIYIVTINNFSKRGNAVAIREHGTQQLELRKSRVFRLAHTITLGIT